MIMRFFAYLVDFSGGFDNDVLEESVFIDIFESLSLLQNVDSSVSNVSLKVDVFVGQELIH